MEWYVVSFVVGLILGAISMICIMGLCTVAGDKHEQIY